MRNWIRGSVFAVWLFGVSGVVWGQGMPKMPGRGDDFFNLGPTGAAGTPLDAKQAEEAGAGRAPAIRVDRVDEKTPAAGHLRKGDVILTAGGRPFPKREDPVHLFSRAVEAAEASRTGILKLTVLRGGRPQKVAFKMRRTGPHSRTCPSRCKKCKAAAMAGLKYLADHQSGDGSFECFTGGINGKVAVTTVAGLAFLASGSVPGQGPFGKPIEKAVGYVMRNAGKESVFKSRMTGKGNMSQVNWNVGYAPWLLAEAYKTTGNPALLEKIKELCAAIVKNQETSGGWGHGPGGPNALNYVELEIVSNFCLTSLGAAQRLGVEVPKEPVDRAIEWIVATSAGDGGVGYSTRPGQQGFGDAGRTAGAIIAFHTLKLDRHPFFGKMKSYFRRNMDKLIGGHVSPCMHLLSGAMAAKMEGRQTWKAYMNTFRDEFMAARCPDGSFSARPTKESQQLHHNTDRGLGPAWITAHYTLVLLWNDSKLRIIGK